MGEYYFLEVTCAMIRPLGHTTVEWSGTSSMTIAPALGYLCAYRKGYETQLRQSVCCIIPIAGSFSPFKWSR